MLEQNTDTRLTELLRLAERLAQIYASDYASEQDAAQEGRIAAWQAVERFPDKDTTYLRVIVKNAVRNALRPGRPSFGTDRSTGRRFEPKFSGLEPDENSFVIWDTYPSETNAKAVQGWIKHLPFNYREVVVRHFYGGESFQDISLGVGKQKAWAANLWGRRIKPMLQKFHAADTNAVCP